MRYRYSSFLTWPFICLSLINRTQKNTRRLFSPWLDKALVMSLAAFFSARYKISFPIGPQLWASCLHSQWQLFSWYSLTFSLTLRCGGLCSWLFRLACMTQDFPTWLTAFAAFNSSQKACLSSAFSSSRVWAFLSSCWSKVRSKQRPSTTTTSALVH